MFYQEFAYIYDRLMADVDYNEWTKCIKKLFDMYNLQPKTIVDLACGTGNITTNLARMGYEVIGVDISEDMLNVAKDKSRKMGLNIPFVRQNIINLDLHKQVDAVTCMCDGVNYIIDDNDLVALFNRVFRFLKPGGIFIFDISSYYKLSTILGSNTMFDNSDDISFIWNNSFDETVDLLAMEISFFVKEKELYRRFDEEHIQRAYKISRMNDTLFKCGFNRVDCYEGFSLEKPGNKSERIVFLALKNKE